MEYNRNRGGAFTSAYAGYNRRRRYFYCKLCDYMHIRDPGETKPTVCQKCGYKDFQFIASGVESRRYAVLIMLQKRGEISKLKAQVTYRLDVNGRHICNYRADFVYFDKAGAEIVEDAKPKIHRDAIYKLKKALMLAVHGIKIHEVT